jgi:hypothetical protein
MFCNDFTSRMLRRIFDILPLPQPVRRSDKLTNFLYLTIENFGSDSFYRPPVSVHYNGTYIDLRVALSVQEEVAGTGSASLQVLISHAACFTTSCCGVNNVAR